MSVPTSSTAAPAAATSGRRFTAWPLWISLAGLLGAASTVVLDSRIDGDPDFDYPVTVAGIPGLDHLTFRIGGFVGYLTVLALLVAAALWRQRVERRFAWSLGASLVSFGVVASAGAMALVQGWKAALGNYGHGGNEEGSYDDQGLYVLYQINDFGPFIAWVPVLAAAYGLAYMAFREGLVSKALGAASALVATLLLGAVAVTGVPGLPAGISVALVVAGLWLAVGNSAITRDE